MEAEGVEPASFSFVSPHSSVKVVFGCLISASAIGVFMSRFLADSLCF